MMLRLTATAWEQENVIIPNIYDNDNDIDGTDVDEVITKSLNKNDDEKEVDQVPDTSPWLADLFRWYKRPKTKEELTSSPMLVSFLSQVRLLLDGVTDIVDDNNVSKEWEIFQQYSYHIRNILNGFLSTSCMVDTVLCCPNNATEVKCHECVLIENSDYFKALLSHNWSSGDDKKATGDEDGERSLRKLNCEAEAKHAVMLLNYFYGENLFCSGGNLSLEDAMEIYSLAHFWSCPTATLDVVTEYIYDHVDEANSLYALTFAETFSLQRLKDKCLTLAITGMSILDDNDKNDDDQEGGADIGDVLSGEVQDCISVLRRACSFVKSKHNYDMDCSVREMVAILKEALEEEEEVWKISTKRNLEDLNKVNPNCDEEYRSRLLSVQDILDKRGLAIAQRRQFVDKQIQQLNIMGL